MKGSGALVTSTLRRIALVLMVLITLSCAIPAAHASNANPIVKKAADKVAAAVESGDGPAQVAALVEMLEAYRSYLETHVVAKLPTGDDAIHAAFVAYQQLEQQLRDRSLNGFFHQFAVKERLGDYRTCEEALQFTELRLAEMQLSPQFSDFIQGELITMYLNTQHRPNAYGKFDTLKAEAGVK